MAKAITAHELFELIHSLTKVEKRVLTNFISPKQGPKTHFSLLYDRIKKAKEWTDRTEKKIRGTDFQDADRYYQTRDRLANKIIECFVISEKDKVSPVGFIEKAIELDVIDQAWKVLQRQMELAQGNNDFPYLLQLHGLHKEILASRHPGVELSLPKSFLSAKEVQSRLKQELDLRSLLEDIRKGIRLPFESKRLLVEGIQARIMEIVPDSNLASFLLSKIKVGLEFLKGNFDLALEKQKQLINFLKADQVCNYPDLVAEYSFLIRLCLNANLRSEAIGFCWEQSNLPYQNRRDHRVRLTNSIRNKIFVADQFCLSEMCAEALEEIDSHQNLFEPKVYRRMTYFGALVFFHTGQYKKGVSTLNPLISNRSDAINEISWQANVLLFAMHFELGNYDVLDYLKERTRKLAKDSGLIIPTRIVNTILALTGAIESREKKRIIGQEIEQIPQILANPNERKAINFFNYPIWLKSKASGESIVDLFSQIENKTDHANPQEDVG